MALRENKNVRKFSFFTFKYQSLVVHRVLNTFMTSFQVMFGSDSSELLLNRVQLTKWAWSVLTV